MAIVLGRRRQLGVSWDLMCFGWIGLISVGGTWFPLGGGWVPTPFAAIGGQACRHSAQNSVPNPCTGASEHRNGFTSLEAGVAGVTDPTLALVGCRVDAVGR